MVDVILGIVDYLAANASIIALPVVDIQPIELDVPEDKNMPQKVIVVKPHSGPMDPAPIQLSYTRFQLQCFGETAHLAYVVETTAYLALKAMGPSVWAGTYIHNAIRTAGPTPGRDPILQWPFMTSVWLVKASTLDS